MKSPDYSAKARHVLITGRSATGKTSAMMRLIEDSPNNLVLIFDPEHEFVGRFKLPAPLEDFTKLAEYVRENKTRYVPFAPELYPVLADGFDDFCDFCFTLAQTYETPAGKPLSILMVVDELQDFVTITDLPQSFRNCLQRGRRYHLDMICASQQPNLLHNIVRTQTTEVYVFAQADLLATKFNARLGVPAEEILSLRDLHYLRKIQNSPVEKGKIVFDKDGARMLPLTITEAVVNDNETAKPPKS